METWSTKSSYFNEVKKEKIANVFSLFRSQEKEEVFESQDILTQNPIIFVFFLQNKGYSSGRRKLVSRKSQGRERLVFNYVSFWPRFIYILRLNRATKNFGGKFSLFGYSEAYVGIFES